MEKHNYTITICVPLPVQYMTHRMEVESDVPLSDDELVSRAKVQVQDIVDEGETLESFTIPQFEWSDVKDATCEWETEATYYCDGEELNGKSALRQL